MSHHRARHTPLGRWDAVRRVVEEDETFAQAAAWANVSKSTVWEWVRRWREATTADQASLACLAERSSRPHRSPAQVPAEEAKRICELRKRTGWSPRRLADEPQITRSHSTVHQVLRRGGCSRRPAPERPAVIRYEWPCPGSCCTWTSRSSPSSQSLGTLSPATAPGAHAGSAGSTATRSSMTALVWPTASCTTTNAPIPSPRSRHAP
jgi:transposase-like protein